MSDTPDTVTPSGQVPQARPTGAHLSRPMIIAILYLANIIASFTVIIGVVLAYIWRGDEASEEWERTHFTYAIRTFWMGLVLMVGLMIVWFGSVFAVLPPPGQQGGEPPAGFFLVFFGGFLVFGLAFVWYCVRCVMSLARAASGKPMPNPDTWLF